MSRESFEKMFVDAWGMALNKLGENANKKLRGDLVKPSVITIQSEDTKREIAESTRRAEEREALFDYEQELNRKLLDNIYNRIM